MSSAPDSAPQKSYVAAWIATLLLVVAFVAGLVFFPPMYEAPKADVADMVLFFGRFHPILLHLPIGSLIFLTLLELICSTRRGEEKFGDAALLALVVGAAGSVLAVMAGIMLSREGGYVGGSFTLHQTMGIIGTAGVLLALVLRLVGMGQGNFELLHAYRALFFLSFGIMGLGAHFGGNLSHGSKFMTEKAPEPIKSQMMAVEKWMLSFVQKPKVEEPTVEPTPEPKVEPVAVPKVEPKVEPSAPVPPAPTPPTPPSAGAKLVFQDVILPLFEAKCNKCHNEEKAKGGLRLDTHELAMKGGKDSGDKNIIPGKPDDSVTVQRIILPEDDSDVMPPEGKGTLTPEEIALIKWWIQQGASATQKVGEPPVPAELQATVDGILKG